MDAEKPYLYKTKEGITEFPITICPKHPFIAFDSYHSFRKGWHSEKEFYELFVFLLEYSKNKKLHLNLYFDPSDTNIKHILTNSKTDGIISLYSSILLD